MYHDSVTVIRCYSYQHVYDTFSMAKPVLTWVLAGELDCRVTHMCDALAVLLIAEVHAVRVSITAPSHGNTQAIHSALELICVATAGRPCGFRERQKMNTQLQRSHENMHTKERIQILLFDGNESSAFWRQKSVPRNGDCNQHEVQPQWTLNQSKLSHEQRSRPGTVTAIIRHRT